MDGLAARWAGRCAPWRWRRPSDRAMGWAAPRVALVVGNNDYQPKPLLNPVNDAKLMAQVLQASGFEVILKTDADQAVMKDAIKAFGKRLVEAGGDAVGLFYFAGHGVEDKGRNYLIPVESGIEIELDLHTDAVLVDWVLARMKRAGEPPEHGDTRCLPGQPASWLVSRWK